jgi:hypothetical protein
MRRRRANSRKRTNPPGRIRLLRSTPRGLKHATWIYRPRRYTLFGGL